MSLCLEELGIQPTGKKLETLSVEEPGVFRTQRPTECLRTESAGGIRKCTSCRPLCARMSPRDQQRNLGPSHI